MTRYIDSFRGEWRTLSNYSDDPAEFAGIIYPTAEHAFAAAKTLDAAGIEAIENAPTPGAAKRIGRRVPLRADWDHFRVVAMAEILSSKFSRPATQATLLSTGDAILIEGNTWHDNYWGVCSCAKCAGTGLNYLGVLLMGVRAMLP